MAASYGEIDGDLAVVLRAVLTRMRQLSGADLIALYPFDSASEAFYAPTGIGVSEEGLVNSLPDMADQLRRYRADAAQGKAPDELLPTQYGPNVWLLISRRPLVAVDAPRQIDSSFIRRSKIRSVIGLPLLAGEDLVALLYLNYVEHEGGAESFPDEARLAELEAEATHAALAIAHARTAEDLAAFRATTDLVGQVSTIVPHDGQHTFREQLEHTLALVIQASGAEAAAVYAIDAQARRVHLVAAQGLATSFPASLLVEGGDGVDTSAHGALLTALRDAGLHELASVPLRARDWTHGTLVVAGRDPLALSRRSAAVGLLLKAAADLIAGALESHRLVDAMEETNRTFSALSALGKALLQPGATQEQVLEAVVAELTDPAIPEFDFQFATIYLLATAGRGDLLVRRAAGATSAEAIDSVAVGDGNGKTAVRVPRWVLSGERHLDSKDVLSFVARQQRSVVIAAGAAENEQEFVLGFPDEQLERLAIPVARGEGQPVETVRAVLLRATGDGFRPAEAGPAARAAQTPTRDLQLEGAIYDNSGHAELIRVFVPFGSDPAAGGRATGVLEAGYHISRQRQLDRLQIEALNAAAAQVAVAVETARLYEDSKKRAEQLEVVTDVSRAIASSIDLDQTLRLVARNMARVVDADLCLVALFEDVG